MQHIQTWQCVTMLGMNSQMSVSNMEFFQVKIFVLLNKICKLFVNIKLFKIQSTSFFNINVAFILFQKDSLLKYVKFWFQHVSSFSCIWDKDFFFYRYIITYTFKNIKEQSPGTNISGVPRKKHKNKFQIEKLTKNS